MGFWQKYGPNHIETIALGIVAGLGLMQRVGPGLIAACAGAVVVVSYVVRHFAK